MRKSGICPKCSNNQLLHVGAVADVTYGLIATMRLAVIHAGEGFYGEKRDHAGQLTAVVCKHCGYTEFYVLDPENIVPDGKYVHEMNGLGPSAGPHR